jgi:O-antigen ligase
MIGKPLGVGIGMKRGNAIYYTPHPVLSKIPHDSWYVLLWVETGLVGMVLYILMLLYIIGSGVYLILLRLKDPELRGIITAFVCALFGVSLAAYSLEIFGQFPNSILIYIVMTFIFLSPVYDKELEDNRIAGDSIKV